MPKESPCALLVAACLLAAVMDPAAMSAQKPERQQEAQVPGTGVTLREGWQLLFYQGCRYTVLLSWHAEPDGSLATAPDGSNISIRMFRITSWSAHKANIKAVFGHVNVVHEDSEHRLWFEIGDKTRIQHFIDVPSGLTACSALLAVRAAQTPEGEETTDRIANSVGPAPDK